MLPYYPYRRLFYIWEIYRTYFWHRPGKKNTGIYTTGWSWLSSDAILESFHDTILNIAGLGPIFGAIMGQNLEQHHFYGSYLEVSSLEQYIDYLAGMLSLRHNGESLPEIIGHYLGHNFKQFMRGFTVILQWWFWWVQYSLPVLRIIIRDWPGTFEYDFLDYCSIHLLHFGCIVANR